MATKLLKLTFCLKNGESFFVVQCDFLLPKRGQHRLGKILGASHLLRRNKNKQAEIKTKQSKTKPSAAPDGYLSNP